MQPQSQEHFLGKELSFKQNETVIQGETVRQDEPVRQDETVLQGETVGMVRPWAGNNNRLSL